MRVVSAVMVRVMVLDEEPVCCQNAKLHPPKVWSTLTVHAPPTKRLTLMGVKSEANGLPWQSKMST